MSNRPRRNFFWVAGLVIAVVSLLAALGLGTAFTFGIGVSDSATVYDYLPPSEMRPWLAEQYAHQNYIVAIKMLLSNVVQVEFDREPGPEQQRQLTEFARIYSNYLSEMERAEIEQAWVPALPDTAAGHWIRSQMFHSLKLDEFALDELNQALDLGLPDFLKDPILEGRVIAALGCDNPDPEGVAGLVSDVRERGASPHTFARAKYRFAIQGPSSETNDAKTGDAVTIGQHGHNAAFAESLQSSSL